jgi:hypothetical protein
MIDKLTGDQMKLMATVRDEWLSLIFDCKTKVDKPKATELIKWLYTSSGLKEPEKILFVESPLGAQYACNMLKADVDSNVWGNVEINVLSNVLSNVWDNVNSNISSNVWGNVWGNVDSNVWGNVDSNVWSNVRSNVRSNVWSNVRSNVRSNVSSNVWSDVNSNVLSDVLVNAWSNVLGNVEINVRSNVESNQLKYFSFGAYGSVSDYGWLSFYDFFERIGLEYQNEGFTRFKELVRCGIYDMIQLEEVCVVCSLPSKIKREVNEGIGVLHSITESAIAWEDGYEQHYLWGVYFDPELFGKVTSKDVTLKELLSIKNTEQRMAALKLCEV